MSGRTLAAVLVVLGVVALGLELRRAAGRFEASRLVATVARVTTAVAAGGGLSPAVVEQGLRQLERAERLAPSEVAPAMYRGGLYLLSGRARAAVRAYQAAAEIEPRPEVYANLGRAYLELGDATAALGAFDVAILLGGRYQQIQLGALYARAAEGRSSRATRLPGPSEPAAGEAPRP